ncbi:Zn(II)2Cys6 transcription factor [Aspergillus chevalieri]|uniref:Zn(2)-C6 fungal-type domain-containing protein n=1 Tax=Aspergillus chevalieri TaxID=182096 RepID=A0A7R7VWX5_ASPCH|nr:uncharacterized protein ACHE_80177A [Aspergillus chevalieri]BCR92277.1 hypothetical protein ACHE_80177A [Aspergillus chevalieri]
MANNIDKQEIDRVLQQRRKQRESRACYPCRQRKVKCDGTQPCRTCRRRGHPEICAYGVSHSRNRSASAGTEHPAGEVGLNLTWRPEAVPGLRSQESLPSPRDQNQGQAQVRVQSQENRPNIADGGEKEYIFSGDNSVVSILRQRTQDANGTMAREVGSVLGLQNTYNSYPFMDSKTPQERWSSLLQILPQRKEVLKFFHFYRLCAYPFNPILVDVDRFESDLCSYLNAHAAGEFRDPNRISERWSAGRSVGHISLLLATLSAGAHYSDLEDPRRSEACQELARRSFHALRLANFLFRPSLDTIQALLILGNTLQNNGQSDAAWALLGTTVRLAQTLGLHTSKSMAHLPEYVQSRAKSLWLAIVWQDSLLCLCYDRPPIVTVSGWPTDTSIFSHPNLSYTEIMHYVCRMALDITKSDETEMQETSRSLDALATLDNVYSRAEPHLCSREHCRTFHQNLEHLALKMHLCFGVSVLCRPAIKRTQSRDVFYGHELLRTRAKASLLEASKAFLDFQALSIVPLRTWSMVHTVLSSTLLLCIWEETRHDPECRDLQQRVIEVFSATESASGDSGSESDNAQWLSEQHIRALVTLRNAVGSALDQQTEQTMPHGTETAPDANNFFPGFGMPNAFPDGLDISDVSPVTYIDSIMNVPLFDISQENQFL